MAMVGTPRAQHSGLSQWDQIVGRHHLPNPAQTRRTLWIGSVEDVRRHTARGPAYGRRAQHPSKVERANSEEGRGNNAAVEHGKRGFGRSQCPDQPLALRRPIADGLNEPSNVPPDSAGAVTARSGANVEKQASWQVHPRALGGKSVKCILARADHPRDAGVVSLNTCLLYT